jgi:hypothetical protein
MRVEALPGQSEQFRRGRQVPDIPTSEYLVLLRFSGYSDVRSFLRVRGLGAVADALW